MIFDGSTNIDEFLFDCKKNYPNEKIITNAMKKNGIVVLQHYFNENEIKEFNNEFDALFLEKKDEIENNDDENESKDDRIFYVEKYSSLFSQKIYNNTLFNNISKIYKGKPHKKLLINQLTYEKNKIKNSGAGWHRDNHNCQFKVILYLTNVTKKNGPFQFMTNSSKKYIGYPQWRNYPNQNYSDRYTDENILKIIQNNKKCKIYDIIGQKGTIILVDTTYIHHGKIIQEGNRKALTIYFFE